MARVHTVQQILQIFIFFTLVLCSITSLVSANRDLNEDNWKEILEGEWMVKFYAPWCPACTALAPAWRELAARAGRSKLSLRTAAVDVTRSPGLSGRFMVTALPTIFHVKDGSFRQYKGPRDVESLLSFVEQARWRQAAAVPGWQAPDSLQMSLVAELFKLSQALRTVHTTLMETYGLPTWGSYLIFAIATIFIGAILGLVLVCVIDLLYPPRRAHKLQLSQAELASARSKPDEEELIAEDIVDDSERAGSDAERHSASDTSSEGGAPSGDARPERTDTPAKCDDDPKAISVGVT
ncbi:thioredoxin-related transmembrane protein 1-like [Plodia interpunctella]|uniref:thioredoxin-related transmembrane protein 1-like n=1 Tax=Plodia interpunctella TaxID=58824 RepID=UPI002368885F|nr:thioredoxin-related transmembrane protein 1-like [Plodia interpunctella]